MQYQFETEIAREYSLQEAVFVHNLYFWVKLNAANRSEMHFHDGKYWSYHTYAGLVDFFEGIWSETQLVRIVKKCREDGLIETGVFGEDTHNRTLWYTTTEVVDCIYRNRKIDHAESKEHPVEIEKCIKEQIVTTDSDAAAASAAEVVELYNETCPDLPRCLKATEKRKQGVRALRRRGYSDDDFRRCFRKAQQSEFCRGKGGRGWRASFDWLMDETHLVAVLEGRYDALGSPGGGKLPPETERGGYCPL